MKNLLSRSVVAVGVCVRDSADTIQETINCILRQDFPHESMEVIFVDDGSKDETLQILHDNIPKMDMRVKLFHHDWKGLGASRNVLIRNADSEYILWIDGDMSFSADFVTRLVKFIKANPRVGIAKGKQSLEFSNNLLSTLETGSRAVGRMVNYHSSKDRLKSLGTGGSIYRVKAFERAGLFDESLRGYGEDWDIEVRIRKAGWSLTVVEAEFSDHERYGITWRSLWGRYWRRGYYTHYFLHKNKGFLKLYNMFPVVAFVTGFLHAYKLFTATRRKAAFLLPLEYFFKMSAWYVGFLDSHAWRYQPR